MRKLYDADMKVIGYLQEGESGRRTLYDGNYRVTITVNGTAYESDYIPVTIAS